MYAFVDAANLFYGGEKSLGWKIDYKKLLDYLRKKFSVKKVFYYAGVDVEAYRPKAGKEVNLDYLIKYFQQKLREEDQNEAEIILLGKYLQRAKFYKKLSEFGYNLRIKPTKVFTNAEGTTKKANCDVDLTFDMMRYMSQYNEALVLSGDGDFASILEYLQKKHKKIHVLARSERTAREMRVLAGGNFMDFKTIQKYIEYIEPNPTSPSSRHFSSYARRGASRGKRKAPAKDAFHV